MGSSPGAAQQLGPAGQTIGNMLKQGGGAAGGTSRFDAAQNAAYNEALQNIRAPVSNIGDVYRPPAPPPPGGYGPLGIGYTQAGLDGGPPLPAPLIMPTPPARQALASIISRPLNTSGNGSAGQRSSSSGYGGSARGGASGGSSARGGSRR